MDKSTFRKILLHAAVFAMACDGEVHDDEVASIRELVEESPYFAGFDAGPEVEAVLEQLRGRSGQAIENYLEDLRELSLSDDQEVRIYEVLIQMINADDKIHSSERRYVSRFKKALGTSERTLIVNFPTHLDLFMGNDISPHGQEDFKELGKVSGINSSGSLGDL